MIIALAQMKIESDVDKNYRKTIKLIQQASEEGCDLIVFPEIQLSPFFPQYPDVDATKYAQTLDSFYVNGIRKACRDNQIFASPNLYIKEQGRHYDMSLLIDDEGKIVGEQKMVHIAQCEKFYEQSYYEPSEEGFHVIKTKFGKIGVVVCFDRHYPESIRTEALRGADLILIPTANTTSEPSELFQWEIKVQAFHSSVNIAMCNRVGIEEEMAFSGESIVTDYNGKTVAIAGNGEQLLVAEIDISGASEVRRTKPYTSLRRTPLYE